jgi:AP-1 complex subunit mu
MYVPEKEGLIWKIKNFPGGKEFMLRCKFGLPSVAAEEESHGRMPPIRVTFEIPYFTVSGIQVRCHVKFTQPRCVHDKIDRSGRL